MRTLLCILMMGACACATTQWTKPGATQADFARDKWECRKESKGTNDDKDKGSFNKAVAEGRLMKECLEAHGWAQQQQP